jgi:hypothetical protein
MPRDRQALTAGQWEHLGSIIGDYLWDQDRFHAVLTDYLNEQGITNEDKVAVLADETFRRVEAGFARKEKS